MLNIANNKEEFIIFPKRNNLEWLRIIFALQVVITHAVSHLKSEIKLPDLIANFPGVPAFFFVSGFLIYSSYVNSPGSVYFWNRFLRIFPGLLLVTLGGGVIIVCDKGLGDFLDNYKTYLIWVFSQITLGQAYNPELFRSVGVGVINGSLWTITTEIIFYLVVPFIVWLERFFRFTILFFVACSFIVYTVGPVVLNVVAFWGKSFFDLLSLTPLVWGWMFGFGIIAVKYFNQISKLLKFAPLCLLPLVLMINHGDGILFQSSGNRLGVLYFLCYAALILWLAFWLPVLPLSYDISYGAYIWHMPIINLLIILGFPNMEIAVFLTLFMAALSWIFVEKPMLKLKRQSLRWA